MLRRLSRGHGHADGLLDGCYRKGAQRATKAGMYSLSWWRQEGERAAEDMMDKSREDAECYLILRLQGTSQGLDKLQPISHTAQQQWGGVFGLELS